MDGIHLGLWKIGTKRSRWVVKDPENVQYHPMTDLPSFGEFARSFPSFTVDRMEKSLQDMTLDRKFRQPRGANSVLFVRFLRTTFGELLFDQAAEDVYQHVNNPGFLPSVQVYFCGFDKLIHQILSVAMFFSVVVIFIFT